MRWLVLFVALVLAGCSKEPVGRYQFLTNNGVILRGDRITGGIAYMDPKTHEWVEATAATGQTPASVP